MDKKNNYSHLKQYCLDFDIDLFGVADIKDVKKDFMISKGIIEKVDSAVCLGFGLSELVMEELSSLPTKLYSHHYKNVNTYLDQVALKVYNYISKKGYLALPIPASQVIDWQTYDAHLSHRHVGNLAGLGWIGRNNLLVNKDLGCRFRLVSILTNMPLKTDRPADIGCGDCKACINACPAGAIKEKVSDFDYKSCLHKLKEFQRQHIVEQYICGVCVNACRGGKK